MVAQPAVLSETLSSDGSFVDWLDHFEAVAKVNAWDNVAKALWLCVRLVGRAQKTIKSLNDEERADYDKAKTKLMERFQPASKCAPYENRISVTTETTTEDRASFGEDMKFLATKAFRDLNEAAKEPLAVSHYLNHLDPQFDFSVQQRNLKTIAETMTATLKIDFYCLAPSNSVPGCVSQSKGELSFIDSIQSKR